MANLGELIVSLQLNAAEFLAGMEVSRKTMRTFGNEVSDSLSSIGGLASQLLAPFGEMGVVVGQAFDKIGNAAGGAIKSFSSMGGALGAVAGVGAAAAAALAVVEGGAVALAIHTAESEARLGELSQATGVSTQALAGLGAVAKEKGVDIDTLAKSLEIFNTNIVKAAVATPGTVTVFDRLGISVKDASGNIKSTETLFTEVANKLSSLPQPEEGYFARALFGRGGAALIPVLNESKERIQEVLDLTQKLGLGDPTAIANAEKFKSAVADIKLEFEGMGARLTADLLPSMVAIAGYIKDAFDTGRAQAWMDKLAEIIKRTATWAAELVAVISDINHIGAAITAVVTFDFGKAKKEWDATKTHPELTQILAAINPPQESDLQKVLDKFDVPTKRKGGVDLSTDKADEHVAAINKIIASLRQQADAEIALAGATSLSVAQQQIQKAENEAGKVITDLLSQADKTSGTEKQKLIGIINSERAEIHALTLEKQVAKDAVAIDAELNKETLAYSKQIEGLKQLSAAYLQGGEAVASAQIEAKVEADKQKVAQLEEEYARLATTSGVSGKAIAAVAEALAQANTDLDIHRQQLAQIRDLQYDEEINKQAKALQDAIPLQQQLDDAFLIGTDAVQDAKVALEIYNWTLAHPGATAEQLQVVTEQFRQQAKMARDSQIAQEAASYSLTAQWDKGIVQLERVREKLQETGQSTVQIDAKIQQDWENIIHQWDEAAFKSGTLKEAFKALGQEIILEGENLQQKVFAALSKAVDDLSTQIAKFVVTGKANFKQLFESLEESIVKAGLQKLFGSIVSKIPGLGDVLGNKPDGSANNPFYVTFAGGAGFIPGFSTGGDNSSGGLGWLSLISQFAGIFTGGALNVASDLAPAGNFVGDLGALGPEAFPSLVPPSTVFPSFGGGMAEGGDVTPGKAYIVGENHPEWFLPKAAGTIVPTLNVGSGQQMVYAPTYNVTTPDVDSFRRSQSQIVAEGFSVAQMMQRRNRGSVI